MADLRLVQGVHRTSHHGPLSARPAALAPCVARRSRQSTYSIYIHGFFHSTCSSGVGPPHGCSNAPDGLWPRDSQRSGSAGARRVCNEIHNCNCNIGSGRTARNSWKAQNEREIGVTRMSRDTVALGLWRASECKVCGEWQDQWRPARVSSSCRLNVVRCRFLRLCAACVLAVAHPVSLQAHDGQLTCALESWSLDRPTSRAGRQIALFMCTSDFGLVLHAANHI